MLQIVKLTSSVLKLYRTYPWVVLAPQPAKYSSAKGCLLDKNNGELFVLNKFNNWKKAINGFSCHRESVKIY